MNEPNFKTVDFDLVAKPVEFAPIWHQEGYGRVALEGLAGRGARLTPESRCVRCGQLFVVGERIETTPQLDWDSAPWEHADDCS